MTGIWRAFWSPRAQYLFLALLVLLAGTAFAVAGLGYGSAFGTVIGILGLLIIAAELTVAVRAFIRWRAQRGQEPEPPQTLSWQRPAE